MKYKPYTIDELVTEIYENNIDHFESATDDCDCVLHTTLQTMVFYWECA